MTLGRQLLESWDLPKVIYEAVGSHHNPELIDDKSSDAYMIAQVLYIAAICGDLYSGSDVNINVEALRQAGAAYFDMDDAQCQNFLQDIQELVPDIIGVLSIKSSDPNELMKIRSQATEYIIKESLALNQEAHAITNNAKRLEEKNLELEDQAITDSLTGLRNRGFFDNTIKDILECSTQNGNAMGLLILDIDHFKSVNDSYGHQTGDELLKKIAKTITDHTAPNDYAARYGGEEMAIICPQVSKSDLHDRAETLRHAISNVAVNIGLESVSRTVSIGGCILENVSDAKIAPKVINAADAELYRAKSGGRNCVLITSLNA
jgi:diguanylate cyclase (GGDEF)-like protein